MAAAPPRFNCVKWPLHGYTRVKDVGEGSFGKAVLVRDPAGKHWVMKLIDISRMSSKERREANNEVNVLKSLKHEYVIEYKESFQEEGFLCIIMQYAESGDLQSRIQEQKRTGRRFSEEQVIRWFTQAALGLKYIHDKHVLHRDLKSQNFFLTKNGKLQIGDFGIAKVLECTAACAKTAIGTPYYLSPEICQERPYSWSSDVWAMGCILYELCCLKVPFDAQNLRQLVLRITRGPTPQVGSGYSADLRQLCSLLLERDHRKRPTVQQILEQPIVLREMERMLREEQSALHASGRIPHLGAAAAAAAAPPAEEAEAAGVASIFKVGDRVEYNSDTNKRWIPATVVQVDPDTGAVKLDVKPQPLPLEVQRARLRHALDAGPAAPPVPHPAPPRPSQPGTPRRDSVGAAAASPVRAMSHAGQRGSSPALRSGSRANSPGPAAYVPRAASRAGSPSAFAGRARAGSLGPRSNGSRHFSPDPGPRSRALFDKGARVEYNSDTHQRWVPATVNQVRPDTGEIMIDIKPNQWLALEVQRAKLRLLQAGGSQAGDEGRPSLPARPPLPSLGRQESSGVSAARGAAIANGFRGRSPTPSRDASPRAAGTPSRVPTPTGRPTPVSSVAL